MLQNKLYVAQLDNAYELAGVPVPNLIQSISAMGAVIPDELCGRVVSAYFYAGRDFFSDIDGKIAPSPKFFRIGIYSAHGFNGQGILGFREATAMLDRLIYIHSKLNQPYLAVIEPTFFIVADKYRQLGFDVEQLSMRS